MIKTFSDAVKALEIYIPPADKIAQGEAGFRRMKKLAELLGNPQNQYPIIHVGGTSGKGSTATMIAAILGKSQRVGLHTSPHLVSPTERMKINGKNVLEKRFRELVRAVLPYAEVLAGMEWGKPTYFEILAAMTFLYFAKECVDVAVIEVGLGGTIDATNIVYPAVAVLTNVGLDHTEILGDTVEVIASDKVGIIKQGISVVSGVTQPSVQAIIKQRCDDEKATLSLLDKDFHIRSVKMTDTGSLFDYRGNTIYNNVHLSVLGEHQIKNAALAIRTVEAFQTPHEEDLRKALGSIRIPGRMEIVQQSPTVILDGAHNPDKISALVHSMKKLFPNRNIITVLAIKNSKQKEDMLRILLGVSKTFVLTEFDLLAEGGGTISYFAAALRDSIRKYDATVTSLVLPNPQEALQTALDLSRASDIILVTGSIYLIGEIKKLCLLPLPL